MEKGLARQADSENYDVHDLVGEFQQVDGGFIEQSLHANLRMVQVRENPSEVLNTSTISMSGDTEGLAEALSEEGHSLVKAGYIELLGILEYWKPVYSVRGHVLLSTS